MSFVCILCKRAQFVAERISWKERSNINPLVQNEVFHEDLESWQMSWGFESHLSRACVAVWEDRREVGWESILGRNNGVSHFCQSQTVPSITHDSMCLYLRDSRAKEPTVWKDRREVWHTVCLPALLPSVSWHSVNVKLLCFRIQGFGGILAPVVENTWVIVLCYYTAWPNKKSPPKKRSHTNISSDRL